MIKQFAIAWAVSRARILMSAGRDKAAYDRLMRELNDCTLENYPLEIIVTALKSASGALLKPQADDLLVASVAAFNRIRKPSDEDEYLRRYAEALGKTLNGMTWNEAVVDVDLASITSVPDHTKKNFPIA